MAKQTQSEDTAQTSTVTPLNAQALATVEHLSRQAKSGSEDLARSARELSVAMAQAIAAQDAAAHLRRVEILSESALAAAIQLMAEDKIAAGEAIIKAANAALSQAQSILASHAS